MYRVCLTSALVLLIGATAPAQVQRMRVSWYGLHDHSLPRTSDGTPFSAYDPTICAHRTLPFGTRLRLLNIGNGTVAYCTVHDRGPFVKGKSLDVTYALKQLLGMGSVGLLDVEIIP